MVSNNFQKDKLVNIPKHVAMILDGNRRWAKQNNLPSYLGHKQGAENIYNLCDWCLKCGVKYLSLYCLSYENLNRAKEELEYIYNYIVNNFNDKRIDELKKKQHVNISVFGDISLLPNDVQSAICSVQKNQIPANDIKLNLNICICYSGRQEILKAIKDLFKDIQVGGVDINDIDETKFSEYLYTKNCPEPDLLIRCGKEKRVSNFLLWQIGYCELYFCDKLWPEFNEQDFLLALYDFQGRLRRYGK